MAGNIGDLVAAATLDIEPFQSNSKQLKVAMRGIDTSLRTMENNFKNSGKSLQSLKGVYDQTGRSLEGHQKILEKNKQTYENLKKEISETDNVTSQMKEQLVGANAAYQTSIQKVEQLSAKYAQLGKELAIQESGFTKFGNAAVDFGGKVDNAGQKMQSFGSGATKYITAPLALGMGAVTKAAIDWESAFAGVKKTNDEVIDSSGKVTYSYKDLENGLRGLAKELPSSHAEIAAVAEAAGQLGIQTPNVVGFTKTMIDLGESTNLSAEDAAMTLAKFANVTQMSQKDFDRLGSSLVELGNNFATTERDIAAMASRLAGAGHQVGMSEGEILGFATALSSVGVEAEAGGSAFSKVMVEMQLATENGMRKMAEFEKLANNSGLTLEQVANAINKGGKELKGVSAQMGMSSTVLRKLYKDADKSATSLENFANAAGMSNAEFGKLFKDDPSKAISKFIEGLANAEKNGTSAIRMLDDMGIKEVRLRDSLLKAANASDLFGDAVAAGNRAWKENTALTEEANKRYETTESQLKMLKNEAVDMAIDLGGPVVQALRDTLKASEPLIKKLSEGAKAFSELDPEVQQNIVKMGLYAMALGPVTKLLGSVISVTGKTTGAIGKMSLSLGKLAGRNAEKAALTGVATSMDGVATSAVAAGGAKGVGGFLTTLGGVNPVVLGVVGALAIGAGAWIAYDKTVGESNRRTEKWGANIETAAHKSLTKYKEFSDQGQQAIKDLDSGTKVSVESITNTLDAMAEDIGKSADKNTKNIEKIFSKLPPEVAEQLKKVNDEEIKANEKSKTIAEQASKEIVAIYQKHQGDTSKISADEKQIIINNQRLMNAEKVRLMNLSKDEERTILAALNGDIDDMTKKQRQKAMTDLVKYNNDSISENRKQLEEIKKVYGEESEAYQTAKEAMTEHQKKATEDIAKNTIRMAQMNGESFETIKGRLNQLGISYKDHARLVEEANEAVNKSNDLIAQTTNEMSNEAREANSMWKSLVWDEKKAEIKSNVQEEVTKSIQSAEGWNNMKLIIKDANLTSNAKEVIFNAIQASGKWNGLKIDKKLLKAENLQFINTLVETEGALDTYNKLPAEIKKLTAEGSAKMTMEETKRAVEQYNSLPVSTKKMFAENSDIFGKINGAEQRIRMYDEVDPIEKVLRGNNAPVIKSTEDAVNSLNDYDENNPIEKVLKGNSEIVKNAAFLGELALNGYNQNNPRPKVLDGSSAPVAQAAAIGGHALDIFDGNNPDPKDLLAYDYASGAANEAFNAVSAFNSLPSVITKSLQVIGDIMKFEDGTNFHKGGLAMVNDQQGPVYKELITLPTGESFIPQERNVFMPLPRGTRVLKASATKQKFPNYADGIGFENSGIAQNAARVLNVQNKGYLTAESAKMESNTTYIQKFESSLIDVQRQLLSLADEQRRLLLELLRKDTSINLDGKVLNDNNEMRNAIRDRLQYFARG